jgi:cobalt/nickel transport system permease protein
VATRTRTGVALLIVGLLLALGLAAFASPWASSEPDGLNKVAADQGFDVDARDSATQGSPLSGYAVQNVEHEGVSKGLSGVIGVGITLVVAAVVFGGVAVMIRRRVGSSPNPAGAA